MLKKMLHVCLPVVLLFNGLCSSLRAQSPSDYAGTEEGLAQLVTDIANQVIPVKFVTPTPEAYDLIFTRERAAFLRNYNNSTQSFFIPIIQQGDRVYAYLFSPSDVLEFSQLMQRNGDNPALENHPAARIGVGYIPLFTFIKPLVFMGRAEIIRVGKNEVGVEEIYHNWFFVDGHWYWIELPPFM